MTSLKDNFNGIQEYAGDQGLKLDWIDQQGEWGVKGVGGRARRASRSMTRRSAAMAIRRKSRTI